MSSGFVGREAELRELESCLDQLPARHGQLYLLCGDAGIGKTRLAAEIAAGGAERAISVHWGRCWDGGTPAYWPWTQIARSMLGDDELLPARSAAQELESVLRHSPAVESEQAALSSSPQTRFAMFDRCNVLLRTISAAAPLLLIFDDLHAADLPSLLLLQYVARDLAGSAIAVVATVREPDVRIDERRARAIADIARWGKRCRLAGLSEAEAGELIERGLHQSAGATLLHRIHLVTEGNPFFIDEIARLLRSRRMLECDAAEVEIPHQVRDVIRQRLALLSSDVREMLSAASIIGRELDLRQLCFASGLERSQLEELLAEAERMDVIQTAGRERFRFSHVLLRDTLYSDLSSAERSALHLRLGEAWERESPAGIDEESRLAELAYHFGEAGEGQVDKAIDYAEQAGRAALAAYAYETAAEHFGNARTRFEKLAGAAPARLCDLLQGAGEANARAMETEEARAALHATVKLARRHDLPLHFARAVSTLGSLELGVPRGKVDAGLVGLLEEALSRLEDRDPTLRVRLLSRLAVELHYSPVVDQRQELTREAIALAETSGDPATLAYALSSRHFALWNTLSPDELYALAGAVIRQGQLAGDLELQLQGRTWAVLDLIERGDGDGVERELEAYRVGAEALCQPRYLGLAAQFTALRHLWRGRFADSEGAAQQAMAAGERVGRPEVFANAVLLTLVIRREQGRLMEAETLVRLALERAPQAPVVRCLETLVLADLERHDECRRSLQAIAAEHRDSWVADHWRSSLIGCLSEPCAWLGEGDIAAWLYELASPHAEQHICVGPNAYFGPVTHHLGVLAATRGRREEAIVHLRQAVATSEACRGAPWLARSRLALASLLADSDQSAERREAQLLLAAAETAATELGMTLLAERVRVARGRLGAEPPVAAGLEPGATTAVFRRDGDHWTVAFQGQVDRLRDSKGMRYLAELLRSPGREIHVLELAALVDAPPPSAVARTQLEPQIGIRRSELFAAAHRDSKSLDVRLGQLVDSLEIARDLGDRTRIAELELEVQELAAAGGSWHAQERSRDVVRQNVSRALKLAIDKLGERNPRLQLHLRATIRKGRFCTYQPDRRMLVRWSF